MFVTYFTKNWMVKANITVPVFAQTYTFTVKRNHKSYENWCKYILLCEKPSFYITNIGNIQSFAEELREFVANSEFCPQLVKEDFQESQLENEDEQHADDNFADEEQLLVSPLQNPDEEDIVPTQFQIHQIPEDIEQDKEIDDDDVTSEYDAEEFINDALEYDWTLDKTTLLKDMSEQDIHSAPNWLENQKKLMLPMKMKK